jgi:hypothetical protein
MTVARRRHLPIAPSRARASGRARVSPSADDPVAETIRCVCPRSANGCPTHYQTRAKEMTLPSTRYVDRRPVIACFSAWAARGLPFRRRRHRPGQQRRSRAQRPLPWAANARRRMRRSSQGGGPGARVPFSRRRPDRGPLQARRVRRWPCGLSSEASSAPGRFLLRTREGGRVDAGAEGPAVSGLVSVRPRRRGEWRHRAAVLGVDVGERTCRRRRECRCIDLIWIKVSRR